MMSARCWVIGRGGLLGSHLEAELHTRGYVPFVPLARFAWHDEASTVRQLAEATEAFFRDGASPSRRVVAWAAGVGVVGTSREALSAETRVFESFLAQLQRYAARDNALLFVVSSAGGVHGQAVDLPVTEHSPAAPLSDYGRAKVEAEALASTAAGGMRHWRVLIGRLSNLYGPGQNLSKRQGLVSYVSRCVLHRVPARVYVGLDTLRDYLEVSEASERIAAAIDAHFEAPPGAVTKLIASETAVSVSAILGHFRHLSRGAVAMLCVDDHRRAQQPVAHLFRSVVWPDLAVAPVPLLVGIHRLHAFQTAAFLRGELPPP